MRIRIAFIISFILLTHLLIAGGEFEKANEQEWKPKLQQHSSSITNITAAFIQQKHLSILDSDIESKGKFYFQSPDKLRWEYHSPYSQIIIMDGDRIKLNESGNSQMPKSGNRLFKQINKMMTSLVSGEMLDNQDFTPTYYQNEKLLKVTLQPLDSRFKDYINSIVLLFNKSDLSLNQLTLMETSEDYTTIMFMEKEFNSSLPENIFQSK